MKKIVLFTGAGFVAPLGLPTTTRFIEETSGNDRSITSRVVRYLGKAGNDIESILATLDSFSNEPGLVEFLIPSIAGHPDITERLKTNLENFKREAAKEIVRLRKLIFEKLQAFDPEKTRTFYLNVYKQLKELDDEIAVSIFTTNYDLTFETAFDTGENDWNALGLKNIDYAFPFKRGRPVYDAGRIFEWKSDVIEYLKLHGSLDWRQDTSGNFCKAGAVLTPDDPSEVPILYPGYKSIPITEPYSSLHSNLFARLSSADVIVVAGFAFRDSYINSVFESVVRANSKIDIHCLNPVKIEEIQEESQLSYFSSKYSSFHHHKVAVNLGDKPLGDDFIGLVQGAAQS